MIDFRARESHFLDHLAPMWHALPARLRGDFIVTAALESRAHAAGIAPVLERDDATDRITVVASYGDLRRARDGGRRCVLAEHGAGQSYDGVASGSYIGAPDRSGVVAVLVPGEAAAARHRLAHPTIPAHIVGCPKLDVLADAPRPRNARPVAAVSWHWDCRVAKETRSAWRHYRNVLPRVAADERFELVGHGHPRILPSLTRVYSRAEIPVVEDFADVVAQADVYCCDNSSTLFEFAALDRPVVVLNAPWYRRHVDHGLRFWEHADIGVQVDRPSDLADGIAAAIADTEDVRARRRAKAQEIYGVAVGAAARAAASSLEEIHAEWRDR